MKAAVNLIPEPVQKIPCAAHRINDLFKIIKISEKDDKYFVYEYNENDELRKTEINLSRKIAIEETNEVRETVNLLVSKCKHLVMSFSHSDSLKRKTRSFSTY